MADGPSSCSRSSRWRTCTPAAASWDEYIVESSHTTVAPPSGGLPLYGAEVANVLAHEGVLLKLHNSIANPWSRVAKRAFDLLVTGLGTIALLPLFAVLALLIRRDGGPAWYVHERIGKGGAAFGCLKFRSMAVGSEAALEEVLACDPAARREWALTHKLQDDPRVTGIGRFLRRTSLDELPQLFNVIRGEMSLVGPRPITRPELARYGEHQPFYLNMMPGITGLWQSSGRSSTSYEERVALDVWYSKNWSLWNDVVILVRTLPILFRREGAW